MFIAAVVVASFLGFVAGLLSFKIKIRWCPECGATTSPLDHRHVGQPR